jgi:hypothetical protein
MVTLHPNAPQVAELATQMYITNVAGLVLSGSRTSEH